MNKKWFYDAQKEAADRFLDYDYVVCNYQTVTRDRVIEGHTVSKEGELAKQIETHIIKRGDSYTFLIYELKLIESN